MASWDIRPSEQIKEIYQDDFTKIFRSLGLDALRGVLEATPVDTGRARSGWFVTISEPSSQVLDRPGGSAQQVVAEGASRIAAAEIGELTYIQNNVAYIGLLDEGPLPYSQFKSGQTAPANIVDGTVQRLANTFDQ